jgi:hypothetical protein
MPRNNLGPLPLDAADILLDRQLRDMHPMAFRAYVYLLCEQWENGPLPATLKELAHISRLSSTLFKRYAWPELSEYFEKTSVNDEVLLIEPATYSLRLDAVKKLVKRQEMAEKQRARWAKKNPANPKG